MKKTIIIACLFCLIAWCGLSYAVEIEPLRLQHSLSAGKKYSGSFKLKNSSDTSVQIAISTGEYRYIFSSGATPPVDIKKRFLPSCKGWFTFEQQALILKSGEAKEVKFFITVPKTAYPEHLCAVIFDEKQLQDKTRPESQSGSGNVTVQILPRFSIPVYISIKDTERISAEITDLSVECDEFSKAGAAARITLENTGTVHIRPFGTLVIFSRQEAGSASGGGQNGEVVKTLPIGKSLPIFPGYKEIIPVPCRKLQSGSYTAIATIEIAKNRIIQKKAAFVLTESQEAQ